MQSKPYKLRMKTEKERLAENYEKRFNAFKERMRKPPLPSHKTRSDIDKENKAKARYGQGYREGLDSERRIAQWKERDRRMKKEGGTVWTKPKSKRNKNYK